MSDFYIVDLRPEWNGRPYVSFWRPKNAGYAYPLPWAGLYTKEQVDAQPSYYAAAEGGRYLRFPVPCEVVERLAIPRPHSGLIDGDVGPVLHNDRWTALNLRRARYLPEGARRARRRAA